MSFFKKLLGLGGAEVKDEKPKMLGEDDYKGFIISAIEMKNGNEYQLCGKIEKEVDGKLKVQKFIRADRLSSIEEALKFTHKKGRQIIDEQGEALFDNGW